MKLVLFQSAANGEILPGLMTDRGVVDISGAVKKGHTPQLTMQGIIDGFDRLKPALEKLAAEGKAVPAAQVRLKAPLPRPGKILCCIANYWEHAQRDARPLNMFMKNPDAVIGPGDTIVLPEYTVPWAFMHEAELALVIKGPAKMVKADRLEDGRVRLHHADRRLGARAGPPHLAGDAADELARQVVRHVRADRSLHRHRRRDQGPQRPHRAVLERRPAAPQLQHRRHGAPRPRAGRVGHHGDDDELRRPDRLRHQPRGSRASCRTARRSTSRSSTSAR